MRLYPLAALHESHDVAQFDCGEASIDQYLAHEAMHAHASGEAATHVWLEPDMHTVVAYFTLMPLVIRANELPKAARLGGKQIPGYLIAKLGLTRSLRGRGLGPDLLLDALGMVVRAADAAGGRVIVVDSLEDNKVHAFYCAADFLPLDGSYRVWMKVATARAALGPSDSPT